MCTIVFAWQAFPETPVVVAANRDERLDRDARPPEVREGDPAVLAPRDEKAGGTWMGVNEYHLFAGLTNRWVDGELDDERSRGLLVDAVLKARTAADAADRVRTAVDRDSYDGFNLIVADRSEAFLFEYDGELDCRELGPGVHVLVNTGADGEYTFPSVRQDIARTQGENADRVRDTLQPRADETPDGWLDRAKQVLGDHDYGVCIHGDGYGTVSTSLISIPTAGPVRYEYADGPPCRTEARVVDNQV